jgi:hypothetical protein
MNGDIQVRLDCLTGGPGLLPLRCGNGYATLEAIAANHSTRIAAVYRVAGELVAPAVSACCREQRGDWALMPADGSLPSGGTFLAVVAAFSVAAGALSPIFEKLIPKAQQAVCICGREGTGFPHGKFPLV